MLSTRTGRGMRGGRVFQRSQRKETEEVKIDYDAPLESNLNEILRNLAQAGPAARAYLRPLVRLAPAIVLSHHRPDGKMGAWSLLDIFRCVRLLLVDEETEVKAEALRVLRHLTASELTFEVMCRALIPPLVVKSLDIVLDNKVERLQALRLMRRCASVAPLKFPQEFVYCILAVANDGVTEKDNFAKACVATAAELCIVNPRLWLASGTFMTLVRSVLTSNVSEPRAAESLVTTLMYLVNDPKTRYLVNADLGLEYLISPFTDRNFEVYPDDHMGHSEREMKARVALCSVLRSWPGLIYLCSEQSGLTKLIELLRVPDTDTQRSVMDLFFDLFCLQTPEWTTDFRIALLAVDYKTGLQRGWLLYEGFVAAEGTDLIPPISRSVNLSSCYLALLLQAMVMHGLLDAVAEATVCDEEQVSIHATVLLAELLHMCSRLFPHDASHMCHLLPGLIDATMSPNMNIRLKAISVINRLAYIEQFKCETIGVPTSLSLDQQLMFCQQARNERSTEEVTSSSLHSQQANSQQPQSSGTLRRKAARRKTNTQGSNLETLFTNSGVFATEAQFDWDIVKCLLKQPDFEEDPQAARFLERLVLFYLPSSRQFSAIETEREQARNICSALLLLTDFLLDRMSSSRLLDDLINDVCACLKQIQGDNIPPNSVLSPAKASSTLSQAYFLLIGRLTGSPQGLHVLKKATIFEQLTKLLVTSPSNVSMSYNDVYIKLALSSLNYTHPGPSRVLFKDVVTSNPSESARIYCVNLLRMLIRCRLPNLSGWVIELLVQCLADESVAIKATAYEVLNEACDVVENLDALIALDPELNTESDDQAWMLQIRYCSRPDGLALLEKKGVLEAEISRWRTLGSLKYVKWVEDTINQSVSRHRRSADGKYGRRYSGEHKLHRLRPAFCPPHLFGQLVAHARGIDIIRDRDLVEPLCETIRNGHMDTPTLVLYVKAALWGVGHLCKTSAGLRLVQEQQILTKVVDLAKTANVLSLRGTAFYCLCLASVTNEGCDALSAMGWEGVRQSAAESDLFSSRRTESIESQWSLDSSWTSIPELRGRAASTRDSISFDDISLAASDVTSQTALTSPPASWSFADMRKMMHCYTSQADATGYETLKMLRPKRRFQSSSESASPSTTLEMLPQKDDTVYIPSVLVGLVLPRHIKSIFNRSFLVAEKKQPGQIPNDDLPRESFGPVHKRETCLRCGDYNKEDPKREVNPMKAPTELTLPERGNMGFDSRDTPASPVKITTQDREQARNDLLRYVINLAAVYPNNNNKAIEQLLLSMKQKQPWVFSDLCLYSDFCHLLRIFHLRQPFRKFLQELFMDVNFNEFKSSAESTVKKATAISINATAETIREDDEESKEQPRIEDREVDQCEAASPVAAPPPKESSQDDCAAAPTQTTNVSSNDTKSNNNNTSTGPLSNGESAAETDTDGEVLRQTCEQALTDSAQISVHHTQQETSVVETTTTTPNQIEEIIVRRVDLQPPSDAKARESQVQEAADVQITELSPSSVEKSTPVESNSHSSEVAPEEKDVNGDAKDFSVNRRRRRRRKSSTPKDSSEQT